MQNVIRQNIITRLETCDDFVRVGDFPDGVSQIGHNYPSVFVGDGDEIWSSRSGNQEVVEFSIPIYVYTKGINSRIINANDNNTNMIKAVLSDLTNGENSINTIIESVEKGTYEPNLTDYYNPGFYPEITVRKTNFIITYYTSVSCM